MNVGNMTEALKARDEGMASSANHAEADALGWGERAYQAIKGSRGVRRMSNLFGFTLEEARGIVVSDGLDEPDDLRAFGSVAARLIRDGVIQRVGYAPAISSHGSPKALYRFVP